MVDIVGQSKVETARSVLTAYVKSLETLSKDIIGQIEHARLLMETTVCLCVSDEDGLSRARDVFATDTGFSC